MMQNGPGQMADTQAQPAENSREKMFDEDSAPGPTRHRTKLEILRVATSTLPAGAGFGRGKGAVATGHMAKQGKAVKCASSVLQV